MSTQGMTFEDRLQALLDDYAYHAHQGTTYECYEDRQALIDEVAARDAEIERLKARQINESESIARFQRKVALTNRRDLLVLRHNERMASNDKALADNRISQDDYNRERAYLVARYRVDLEEVERELNAIQI